MEKKRKKTVVKISEKVQNENLWEKVPMEVIDRILNNLKKGMIEAGIWEEEESYESKKGSR